MRTFRFSYMITGGAVSLASPYTDVVGSVVYTFPAEIAGEIHNAVVHISDRKILEQGVIVHQGFDAEVEIFGNDLTEARESAHYRLQLVLSMLVLQTNATVGHTELLWGQETTIGASTTEYLQIERMEGALYRRHVAFDHEKLQPLIEAILNVNTSRLNRATRWYRKGLSEEDALERFSCYWLGLECLNKLLIDLLGEIPDLRNCPECGAVYEAPTVKGVRSLFVQHSPNGLEDFKACRNLRVDIQHGGGNLAEIIKRCDVCAEMCRVLLRTGICLLLGSKFQGLALGPEPTYNVFSPWVEFHVVFHTSPTNLPLPPLLSVKNIGTDVSDEEGRTTKPRFQISSSIPTDEVSIKIVAERNRKISISAEGPMTL